MAGECFREAEEAAAASSGETASCVRGADVGVSQGALWLLGVVEMLWVGGGNALAIFLTVSSCGRTGYWTRLSTLAGCGEEFFVGWQRDGNVGTQAAGCS